MGYEYQNPGDVEDKADWEGGIEETISGYGLHESAFDPTGPMMPELIAEWKKAREIFDLAEPHLMKIREIFNTYRAW